MKKLFTGLFLLMMVAMHAQVFNGAVFIRDNSMLYLNQVYVTNLTTQKTVLADYQGEFSLPANVGDIIRFTSIVTDRRDIPVTQQYLDNKRTMVELTIAYRDIQEVVIKRFRPTGNFKIDVLSIPADKRLALQQKIGLPSPKGDGHSPSLPTVNFKNGGIGFSVQNIYDMISGERKKQERLYAYEGMQNGVSAMRQYFGDDYFIRLKIPKNLIDNFLQFVYTSDDLRPVLMNQNFSIAQMSIEKYLPVYLKRLKTSNLQTIVGDK